MRVEQPNLRDGGRTDESRVLIELRAGFHTAATRDATRQRIGFFLVLHGDSRPRTKVVAAIDRYPGFHFFQILEEHAAIDGEIANDGKFRERLELDRLIEVVEQRRAGHAGASVD